MSAEIHRFPEKLDLLTNEIKDDLKQCAENDADWVETRLKLCIDLARARKEFDTNEGFGQWFTAGGFDLNKDDRAAAIAMGQEPERAREVLTATKRRSLQHICAKEFRILHVKKTPKPPTEKQQRALDAVDRIAETGEKVTHRAVVADAQVSMGLAQWAIGIRQAADPEPLPPLSMTAQQKLEVWQRKLEADFDYRVRLASQKWLDEVRIPLFEKKLDEIERMLKWPRNAVMTKPEYNAVMRCLHPDSLHSRTEEQLAEAFRIFTHYKAKMVSDEEVRKAVLSDFPRTREEMLARKKSKSAA